MYLYLGLIGIMSMITFILYGVDKRKAIKKKWRVKESSLLILGFLFGALGGLIGMNVFRHKTKHWYFVFLNGLFLVSHIGLGFILYAQGLLNF
jgi:uncharacterized membrane protein YsdA (DUF1294 family)